MYEAILLGDGPAGVSASLYLARAGYRTAIIAAGRSALRGAERIDNFYGCPGVTGEELLRRGRKQAASFGVDLIGDEIFAIEPAEGGFRLTGAAGEYEAKCVLLATGAQRAKPAITGLADYEGAGVSYCAVCDGFFFRGKKVFLLGNGNFALHELEDLLQFNPDVTVLTGGEPANPAFAARGVPVIETPVQALTGDQRLSHIALGDGRLLEADGLFVALGTAGAADLARKTGIVTEGQAIKTDASGATSMPGIFAAGDCTGGLKQVAVAAGEGAAAGMSMIRFLRRGGERKNNL